MLSRDKATLSVGKSSSVGIWNTAWTWDYWKYTRKTAHLPSASSSIVGREDPSCTVKSLRNSPNRVKAKAPVTLLSDEAMIRV